MSGTIFSGTCSARMIQSSPAKESALSASATSPISTKDRKKLFFRRSASRRPNWTEKNALLPMHSPRRIEVRKVISV